MYHTLYIYWPSYYYYYGYYQTTGQCCVCLSSNNNNNVSSANTATNNNNSVNKIRLFKFSQCDHLLCAECGLAYLQSSLKDISLLPIKCPLIATQQCPVVAITVTGDPSRPIPPNNNNNNSTISMISDSMVCALLSSQVDYDRYCRFLDQILYGPGTRCLICTHYNRTTNHTTTTTTNNNNTELEEGEQQCEYCLYHYCQECLLPWFPTHSSNSNSSIVLSKPTNITTGTHKCRIIEQLHYRHNNNNHNRSKSRPTNNHNNNNNHIEEQHHLLIYQLTTGAQHCPACHKLIEKEGNDTEQCHHMVHRDTDAIPCSQRRCDFCYLCGEEVTASHPHLEVQLLKKGKK
jgi:hypothetical protein